LCVFVVFFVFLIFVVFVVFVFYLLSVLYMLSVNTLRSGFLFWTGGVEGALPLRFDALQVVHPMGR
jgi:hypothetical protein